VRHAHEYPPDERDTDVYEDCDRHCFADRDLYPDADAVAYSNFYFNPDAYRHIHINHKPDGDSNTDCDHGKHRDKYAR
jgi:hypothetical protein